MYMHTVDLWAIKIFLFLLLNDFATLSLPFTSSSLLFSSSFLVYLNNNLANTNFSPPITTWVLITLTTLLKYWLLERIFFNFTTFSYIFTNSIIKVFSAIIIIFFNIFYLKHFYNLFSIRFLIYFLFFQFFFVFYYHVVFLLFISIEAFLSRSTIN